jgi:centromere protein J
MVKTTLNNGIKIYKFKNGQIEKHFPDGTKLIIFNDDTEKYIYNDGSEETYFSDGNSKKNRDIIFEKTLEEDN